MSEPLPALRLSVGPEKGARVFSNACSAEAVVPPMSKQCPVLLMYPVRYHRT